MGKWLRILLIVILAGVFAFSAGSYLLIQSRYRVSQRGYDQAAEQFTSAVTGSASSALPPDPEQGGEAKAEAGGENIDRAPIKVDFDALIAINDDVMGWIYCEGTVINYPVVWGRDNSFYLERNYRKGYDPSGAIFSDCGNMLDFSDNNTILYGHHMANKTMFATLKKWLEQDYYEEHPCMWLLTPQQDYRVELIAGYVTAADSEAFTIYRGGGPEFREYLRQAMEKSKFKAPAQDQEIDESAKYVMLSTCAYSFELARTVLHGKLTPVAHMEGEAPDTLPDGKSIRG